MWWYDEQVQRGFWQDYPSVPEKIGISRIFSTLIGQFPEQLQEDREIVNITRWRTVFEFPRAAALVMEMQSRSSLSKHSTVEWLDRCCKEFPCMETIARTSRNGIDAERLGLGTIQRDVPKWYADYLKTRHFNAVRKCAADRWMPRNVACVFNQRHGNEIDWHHNDYGLLVELMTNGKR